MEIALVGDSHVPFGVEEVPGEVMEAVEDADLVLHTGDFDSRKAFRIFAEASESFAAVRGNMDPSALSIPTSQDFDVGDTTFLLTHGTDGVDAVLDEARDVEAEVAVYGHSHEPADVERDGVRLVNPGSCTGADPASRATY
ncbi:MAG: YfcE family phosphodiesterase, partial [Halobacteriota archaeon]